MSQEATCDPLQHPQRHVRVLRVRKSASVQPRSEMARVDARSGRPRTESRARSEAQKPTGAVDQGTDRLPDLVTPPPGTGARQRSVSRARAILTPARARSHARGKGRASTDERLARMRTYATSPCTTGPRSLPCLPSRPISTLLGRVVLLRDEPDPAPRPTACSPLHPRITMADGELGGKIARPDPIRRAALPPLSQAPVPVPVPSLPMRMGTALCAIRPCILPIRSCASSDSILCFPSLDCDARARETEVGS